MHDNHETDLMSDWDLSQLRDDDQNQEPEEVQQEFTGEMVW